MPPAFSSPPNPAKKLHLNKLSCYCSCFEESSDHLHDPVVELNGISTNMMRAACAFALMVLHAPVALPFYLAGPLASLNKVCLM